MLYMGYVGFAVPFAFAIAAMLGGQLDAAWARWSRPWTHVAWAFLTLGPLLLGASGYCTHLFATRFSAETLPQSLAFLAAADAGVVPVTSAGNNGPGAGTIGSPADAPWMLSVGASTHNRAGVNALINMTGGDTTPPADIQGILQQRIAEWRGETPALPAALSPTRHS